MTSHGMTNTRLYRIWAGIRARCFNENDSGYAYYGGRGIKVCEEWDSFETFRDWALANGYRDPLELDRRDNNKNYEPSNCRWATREQQMRNTGPHGGTSRFKGVSKRKDYWKWRAAICVGPRGKSKFISLGYFATEEEAAKAYDVAARERFGEFAYLNFPMEATA